MVPCVLATLLLEGGGCEISEGHLVNLFKVCLYRLVRALCFTELFEASCLQRAMGAFGRRLVAFAKRQIVLSARDSRVKPQSFSGHDGLHRMFSGKLNTWLILPVVICLSQRLSHACLSISSCTAKLRMAH